MLSRVGLEKDRMGPMTWPGGKAGMAWPYTGRRVSSLVPWGGSEEPETVEVSQDVVYRRGEEDWEGEGVGGGAGVEGEGGGGKAREKAKEKEREQAREKEREKAREKEREKGREKAREKVREKKVKKEEGEDEE
jgi:hypothetical protein